MDMRMPVMDGYEATRRIKASTSGPHTPVVAVTASALEDDRQGILDCGVDAYLSKPVEPARLFGTLQSLLTLRYHAPAEPQAASTDHDAISQARVHTSVSADMRRRMRQALEQGDMASMEAQLAELLPQDSIVAKGLQDLANDFEFDALQQLLADLPPEATP
jgi:CheY-like chemotaxis protein